MYTHIGIACTNQIEASVKDETVNYNTHIKWKRNSQSSLCSLHKDMQNLKSKEFHTYCSDSDEQVLQDTSSSPRSIRLCYRRNKNLSTKNHNPGDSYLMLLTPPATFYVQVGGSFKGFAFVHIFNNRSNIRWILTPSDNLQLHAHFSNVWSFPPIKI